MAFCPFCNNILFIEENSEGRLEFVCTCPVSFPIKKVISYRNYYKLKEIDDVLGGEEAWKNVDSTEERCPKCSHNRAYFMQIQTRSADEPMTTFYRCCNNESRLLVKPNNALDISMPQIISIDNPTAKQRAIEYLKKGFVIAVPTDTVYGLACDATNVAALNKLYATKSRDFRKPMAVCVSDIPNIKLWSKTEHLSEHVLNALLPGPVTLILRSSHPSLDKSLIYKRKIGIRIPDYDFIRDISRGLGRPLALTSANLSNEPSALEISEFANIWDRIPAIFDGGRLELNRSASTIVDLSKAGVYQIVRQGAAYENIVDLLERFGLKKKHENINKSMVNGN